MAPAPRRLALGPVQLELPATPHTFLYGVLGDPVSHSLSPTMQQAAFDAAGEPARYLRFPVVAAQLAAFVDAVRRPEHGVRGFNVTVPHKMAILPFLDDIDDVARQAGAVNTVVVTAEGRLRGANTDVLGLEHIWQRRDGVPGATDVVVVVGAGGMARAAVLAAQRSGAGEIRVLNRTLSRARELLDELSSSGSARLRCAALDADAVSWLTDASILVQASALGMQADDPSPVSLQQAENDIPDDMLVIESVTVPETRLLQQARRLRLHHVEGRELLLAQGVESWRLWMGRQPDVRTMRDALFA